MNMRNSLPFFKILTVAFLFGVFNFSGTCLASSDVQTGKSEGNGTAVSVTAAPGADAAAADFFRNVRHESVLSDFEQTRYVAEAGRSLKSSGRMLFTVSDGLCWKMEKPFKRSWLFLGDGVTEYQPDGSSRSVSGDGNGMFNGILLSVLNGGIEGNTADLTANFDVTDGGYDSESHVHAIYLKPLDKQIGSVIYRIKLERKGDVLHSITIMEHGNSYTRMVFVSPVTDAADAGMPQEFCRFR